MDRLGTHAGGEILIVLILGFTIFGLGQKLTFFEGGLARINDDVILVIENALQLATCQIEHKADTGRHALVEPDMGDGNRQIDMSHPLAAHTTQRHLDTATVTDNILVLDALVLSAGALPIPGGAENSLAEQTAFFGLEGPVVDGLGVFDFPLAPAPDGLRSCYGDPHLVERSLFWIRVNINRCKCCVGHGSLCCGAALVAWLEVD